MPTLRAIEAGAELPERMCVPVDLAAMGQRLREAREAKKMTQAEVAERIGVKVPSYWRYESGGQEPGGEALAGLCKTLGVSAEWIMFGIPMPASPARHLEEPFAYEEELRAWLETPEGKTVTDEQLAELRLYRGKRRPDDLMWHWLLQAARSGVPAHVAQAEAEETDQAMKEALERGGRPLQRKKK